MHTVEIPYCKFYQEIPSEISELSTQQYFDYVRYFLELMDDKITYEQWRIKMIVKLLHITRSVNILTEEEREILQTELFRLSELMDSFTYRENEQVMFNLSFTKNLVPQLRVKKLVLYGPSDALQDVFFQEYIDAHNHYCDFLDSKDTQSLDQLIAVLYRPEIKDYQMFRGTDDFNGQRRVRYNDNTVADRARLISSLPFHVRYSIFLQFRAWEEFMRTGSIVLGGAEVKFSTLYRVSPEGEGDNTGLVGILFTLAESGVFGNAEETSRTNIYDVFVRLYQLVSQYKKSKTEVKDDSDKAV